MRSRTAPLDSHIKRLQDSRRELALGELEDPTPCVIAWRGALDLLQRELETQFAEFRALRAQHSTAHVGKELRFRETLYGMTGQLASELDSLVTLLKTLTVLSPGAEFSD